MIEVEIDKKDLAKLKRSLKRLEPKQLLKEELDPLGKQTVQIVGKYPPPMTSYKRTGHLGRSWYHKVYGLDLKIGNLAKYAGWVHGEEQRSFHKARGWKQLFGIADSQLNKLIRKLMKKVERIWTR